MADKIENIQELAFNFACRIVRLYQYLVKKDRTNETLCRQLVRSGTSIGANLEEANAAQSPCRFYSEVPYCAQRGKGKLLLAKIVSFCKHCSRIEIV